MRRLILLSLAGITVASVQEHQVFAQEGVRAADLEDPVLESYPVYSTGPSRYQVVLGPCGEDRCPSRIVLVGPQGELSAIEMEYGFFANSELQIRNDWWITYDTERGFVALSSRLVRLTPDWNGVLVSHTAGVDLPGQTHHLLAEAGDSLVELWSRGPNVGGPTFNRVLVRDVDQDGADELGHISGQSVPFPDMLDRWYLKTFSWDPSKGEVVEVSEPGRGFRAYAAILGSYETLAEARQEQEVREDCLPFMSFQVLESSDFPRLRPGYFILAYLTTERDEAFQMLEDTKDCVAPIVGYVRRAQ